MSARLSLRRDERGFTLIELSTTMALLGILLAAIALTLSGAIRTSSAVEDQAATQAEVRAAVDVMAGELRQAYSDTYVTPWLQTMTGTQLTFYTPDRQTPFHLRLVSYRLSGGTLQRAFATSTNTGSGPWSGVAAGNLGAWRTQARDIKNSTLFTYLDANGNTTAVAANVARVQIKVSVSPRGSQGRLSTYVVQAGPRL